MNVLLPYEAATGNYTPNGDPSKAQSWVVLAFGAEAGADGAISPGPANVALGRFAIDHILKPVTGRSVIDSFEHPSEHRSSARNVVIQGEVADAMQQLHPGILEDPRVHVVRESTEIGTDGEPAYLDSHNILLQARTIFGDVEEGTIGIAAVAHHVSRAAWQAEAVFPTSTIIKPERLPRVFAGPNSTQWWTRSAGWKWAVHELITIGLAALSRDRNPNPKALLRKPLSRQAVTA